MTIEQMTQTIQNLGADETCPICRDRFMIKCYDHMTQVDADGWCVVCDSPATEPQEVSCPCQDL